MAQLLIVDDDRLFVQIYATRLEAEGHQITLCFDGLAAQKAVQQKFDLISLDIMMPNSNGLELLRHIQTTPNKTTPVVVLSNLLDPQTKAACLAQGAKEYLLKADFTPNQLIDKIKTYL